MVDRVPRISLGMDIKCLRFLALVHPFDLSIANLLYSLGSLAQL